MSPSQKGTVAQHILDYRRSLRGRPRSDPYIRGRRAGYLGMDREIMDYATSEQWLAWYAGFKDGRQAAKERKTETGKWQTT